MIERASLPLESAAVQLGCSEFIFEFLLEPFLARDTGWTVAAGRFWCDHNLESLPPARPLCPPNTLTWGPSREVELPHQFSSLRTPRFDSAPAPLSSGPSRVTIPSITPCVLSLPSSPRNFARSLDPFPCLLSLRSLRLLLERDAPLRSVQGAAGPRVSWSLGPAARSCGRECAVCSGLWLSARSQHFDFS